MNRIAGISEKCYTALYKIYEDLHVWIWHLIGGPMNNIKKIKLFLLHLFLKFSFLSIFSASWVTCLYHLTFFLNFMVMFLYFKIIFVIFFCSVCPHFRESFFFYVKMLTQNNFGFSLWPLALSDFRFLYLFYMLETFHVL